MRKALDLEQAKTEELEERLREARRQVLSGGGEEAGGGGQRMKPVDRESISGLTEVRGGEMMVGWPSRDKSLLPVLPTCICCGNPQKSGKSGTMPILLGMQNLT